MKSAIRNSKSEIDSGWWGLIAGLVALFLIPRSFSTPQGGATGQGLVGDILNGPADSFSDDPNDPSSFSNQQMQFYALPAADAPEFHLGGPASIIATPGKLPVDYIEPKPVPNDHRFLGPPVRM